MNVYDYEHVHVGEIELSEIANLLVHNRYVVVKGSLSGGFDVRQEVYVGQDPQMGLRVNFDEYFR